MKRSKNVHGTVKQTVMDGERSERPGTFESECSHALERRVQNVYVQLQN
jgi:hypothetical protein